MCYITCPSQNDKINKIITTIIHESFLDIDAKDLSHIFNKFFLKNTAKNIQFFLKQMYLDEETLAIYDETNLKYQFQLWSISKIGEEPEEDIEIEEDNTKFDTDDIWNVRKGVASMLDTLTQNDCSITYIQQWLNNINTIISNYKSYDIYHIEASLLALGAISSVLSRTSNTLFIYCKSIVDTLIPIILSICNEISNPFLRSISAFVLRCYCDQDQIPSDTIHSILLTLVHILSLESHPEPIQASLSSLAHIIEKKSKEILPYADTILNSCFERSDYFVGKCQLLFLDVLQTISVASSNEIKTHSRISNYVYNLLLKDTSRKEIIEALADILSSNCTYLSQDMVKSVFDLSISNLNRDILNG